jgi:bacterioferritin-associated ferredoxin
MEPDDQVCLCFHVSLRKLRAYLEREDPPVASKLSECLGAGTGCQWCVPSLTSLYEQHQRGEVPDLPVSPEQYATKRQSYRDAKRRERPES